MEVVMCLSINKTLRQNWAYGTFINHSESKLPFLRMTKNFYQMTTVKKRNGKL